MTFWTRIKTAWRTLTGAPDPEALATIRQIAADMRASNNACTADPIYTVQERCEVYGGEIDWHGPEDTPHGPHPEMDARVVWVVSDERDCELHPRRDADEICEMGEDEVAAIVMIPYWQTVSTHMSEHGAREYIRDNATRHAGELRMYVESAWRNREMIALREAILALGDLR